MTFRSLTFALALFVGLQGPAFALSCMRPDAVRLYEMARDADELFVMVRGRVEVSGPPLSLTPKNGEDQTVTTTAMVSGAMLTSHEFGRDFEREITLEVSCLGPWCGGTDGLSREQFLAIQVTENDLVLHIGPCGGDVVNWDRDGERRMLAFTEAVLVNLVSSRPTSPKRG